MKKKISNYLHRVRIAWRLLTSRQRCFCRFFLENESDERMYRAVSYFGAVGYFDALPKSSIFQRLEMIATLLNADNSVILLSKEQDGINWVTYDCQSQEDFDELRSCEYD